MNRLASSVSICLGVVFSLLFACKHSAKSPVATTDANSASSASRGKERSTHSGDRDADGFLDADDQCPDEPEDLDNFDDGDGCPDRDNDGDGVLDAYEFIGGRWTNCDYRTAINGVDIDCRNLPEDHHEKGGFDGCPEVQCLDQCDSKLSEAIPFDREGRLGMGSTKDFESAARMLLATSHAKVRIELYVSPSLSSHIAQGVLKNVIRELVERGVDSAWISSIVLDGKTNEGRVELRLECRCGVDNTPSKPHVRLCI